MPRNPKTKEENFKKLQIKFSSILSNPTISKELVLNFFNFVMPSLAEPVILKDISSKPRFRCLFAKCMEINQTYSTKQKYIYHLCIFHDHELPEQGKFLCPNDRSNRKNGFLCEYCPLRFNRKDHFLNHMKKAHNYMEPEYDREFLREIKIEPIEESSNMIYEYNSYKKSALDYFAELPINSICKSMSLFDFKDNEDSKKKSLSNIIKSNSIHSFPNKICTNAQIDIQSQIKFTSQSSDTKKEQTIQECEDNEMIDILNTFETLENI